MDHSAPDALPVAPSTADTDRADASESGAVDALDRAEPGDAVVIVGLVAAPTLRHTVSPDADALLHESLRRILEETVPDDGRVLPWPHGQFLAVLPRTTRANAATVAGEVRRRWHCSWTAPVAVASGVSAVDASTPATLAAMLAGAELSAAKERATHA